MSNQINYAQLYHFLIEQKNQLESRKEKLLQVTDVNADTYLSACKDHNTYAYYKNNIRQGSRSRISLVQTSPAELLPLAVNTANTFLLGNCSEPLLTAGRSQRSQQKQLSKLHKR